MAAYRRFYDSRHLQADCQEPGSAPETYTRQSSMGYVTLILRSPIDNHRYTQIVSRKSLKWTTGKSQPSPYHTDWLSCGFTSHSSVFYETDRQTDRRIVVVVDIRHARVRHQSPVHHRHQYCFQHRLCLCLGLLVNSKVTTDSYK